ncbi:MAG TPA: hypothetical protein VME40_07065 [Caulobacteraceae bacterium]|nr:hypothetical protein [Caulobacteraceae bacterium]
MKHAGQAALDGVEPLLARIRDVGVLREKSRGVFYLKSRAWLHFHEDPAGMFVDVRAQDGKEFERLKLDPGAEREILSRLERLASPPRA